MKFTELDTNYVMYNNQKYELNLAFTYVLQYFEIAHDKGLAEIEKMMLGLELLCKTDYSSLSIEHQQELFAIIFNEKINLREHKLASKLFKNTKKSYDLEIDADRIQASFLMQYPGIDLTDKNVRKSMSWSEFNALLDGLKEDTPFREAMKFRTMEMPEDAEQASYVKKMKTLYALSDEEGSEELTLEQQMAGMDRTQKAQFLIKRQIEKNKKGGKQ